MKTVLKSSLVLIAFILILVLVFVAATLIHEVGHGLVAEALGGDFISVYVFPGIQIWPEFGTPHGNWGKDIALMYFSYGPDWQLDGREVGAVHLMGSGTNLLLATLALGALWAFQPRGLIKWILVAESLMFLDIVFYTFLPLLGMRHMFFIGGDTPEPLEGAILMGIPQPVFLVAISVIFVLYTVGLVRLVIKRKTASST